MTKLRNFIHPLLFSEESARFFIQNHRPFLLFSCGSEVEQNASFVQNDGMFPPFPQEKAALVLEKLLSALDDGGIVLEQVSRPSGERKNQAVMLGALVCADKNGREVNLVTSSGLAKRLRVRDSDSDLSFRLVPPVVSADEIVDALSANDEKIHELTDSRGDDALRKKLCAESLEKVHALYRFHCIDGKVRTLREICGEYNHGRLPPTGTGDCCAPKLLDYAFSRGLMPVSLAEMRCPPRGRDCSRAGGVLERPQGAEEWSGSGTAEGPTAKPDRPCRCLVSPCDERCGILLPAMLGLRILWRDDAVCVVNKQPGLLSVRGRGEEKQDSVETRFLRLFGDKAEVAQPAVHRLDMETSGVMILAFTKAAHRGLCRQFEERSVEKEYVALLDGVLQKRGIAEHGEMELFFRLDVENRPHQIWDAENGKRAVTEWQILNVERYHAPDGSTRDVTRVLFRPRTGRTHQLRLASADSHGFGVPIIGDTLYGKCGAGERLMLHARKITFSHPVTGVRMTVECAAEF